MNQPDPNPGLDAARDRGHARANHELDRILAEARGMAAESGPERAWSALAINLAELYGLGLDQMATGVLAAAVLRLDEQGRQ